MLTYKVHLRCARRLYKLCCNNGGVFIKAGQHVGALDYLLPTEYVETMKVLHNDAPCSELEDIKMVVEEDLGCKVNISEAKSLKVFTSLHRK